MATRKLLTEGGAAPARLQPIGRPAQPAPHSSCRPPNHHADSAMPLPTGARSQRSPNPFRRIRSTQQLVTCNNTCVTAQASRFASCGRFPVLEFPMRAPPHSASVATWPDLDEAIAAWPEVPLATWVAAQGGWRCRSPAT
jgi:hypothetical protein